MSYFVQWPTASCVYDTDASDWDSASTTSKRTLPGRRMASPGHEFPECSHPSVKELDEDDTPTAPLTPQRVNNSNKTLHSTPPQPVPHPQPRARKMVLQKPESEEGKACKHVYTVYHWNKRYDYSIFHCLILSIIQNQMGKQTIWGLHPKQPKLTLSCKT